MARSAVRSVTLVILVAFTGTAIATGSISIGHITGTWPLAKKIPNPRFLESTGSEAEGTAGGCPNKIEHIEFTRITEFKEATIYSVDFDKIKVDGELCSDPDPVKDRFLVLPSEPPIGKLLSLPVVDTINLSTLFSAGFVGNDLQTFVDSQSLGSFLVGLDLSERKCGDRQSPANTPYIFVAPENDKTISSANGLIIEGGKDSMISVTEEAVCVYTRDRTGTEATPVNDILDSVKECFPGSEIVELEGGRQVSMDNLQVGNRVLVAPGSYSDVFSFTHRDNSTFALFVKIETHSGHSLHATGGHYLHVNGFLKVAKHVQVGDRIVLGNGSSSRVIRVSQEVGQGLFNPQTMQGDIVVSGVLASTYTNAVEPNLAHFALSPLRKVYGLFDLSTSLLESVPKSISQFSPTGSLSVQ